MQKNYRAWQLIGVIALVCGGAIYLVHRNFTNDQRDPLFDGFNSLTLPRSGVQVGAEWKDEIGPIGSGLDARLLAESKSLDRADIASHGKFAAAAETSLKQYMAFGRKESYAKKVNLAKVSIVTVANASSLPIHPGALFIWEAIRVDSFTAETTKGDENELKARLSSQGAKIETSSSSESLSTVSVSGTNLYLAYRLVAEKSSDVVLESTTLLPAEPKSEFDLGGYHLSFRGPATGQSVLGHCSIVIEVADANRAGDAPSIVKTQSIPCGASALTLPLGRIPSSDLLAEDTISGKNLILTPVGTEADVTGIFTAVRRTVTIARASQSSAPGW